jgi:hypothetical protein
MTLGVIGLAEMAIVGAFWPELLTSESPGIFGRGAPVARLSAIFIVAGLLGMVGFVIELIAKKYRFGPLKALATVVYISLFVWVSYLYRGV